MGVYIKNMELPDKCGHCRFATALECEVTHNFITTFNVRQLDCPLVAVPKNARLIDANALKEKWTHRDLDLFAQGWGYLHDLNRAPTIIDTTDV